uniref:Uncharacterized protein n=1 Tax=Lactuca sativa TaxID=4236 RepID=A0A9R1XAE4_LACSA|nr:hypothetical protein LSAT_V11C500259530 [Lactuca sativa]
MIFQDDINNVHRSLSFTRLGSAQSEYWYGVIIYFLDKQGLSTCFPLWHGPQYISHHRSILIYYVYNERSARWEILYNVRLNAYVSPNAPRNNCNLHVVDVPDI